jgi:hypothetical protein
MSDKAESPASRLWRDQVQLREHERDEARARTRISEEKVAILTAENDRLADEIARLRALLTAAHPAQPVPRRNSRWRTLERQCCPSWISRAGSNLRIWLPDRFGLAH